jgi:hypothetical protein
VTAVQLAIASVDAKLEKKLDLWARCRVEAPVVRVAPLISLVLAVLATGLVENFKSFFWGGVDLTVGLL